MRDTIYEKTLEQHNLRYDHSLLQAYNASEKQLDVGSVMVTDGFFDADGNNLLDYHSYALLPDGDINSIVYLQSLTPKTYWYSYTECSVSNMPSNYGFVFINTTASATGGDVWVLFKEQGEGCVYFKSCNNSYSYDWRRVIDEESDEVAKINKLRGFAVYFNASDLGYSNGTSLATLCSAMPDGSIALFDYGTVASSDLPASDLWMLEIRKRNCYRCVIDCTRGGNYTSSTSYAYRRNWRTDSGLTGWKTLV